MLQSYLRSAFRSLRRDRAISVLNITGLAIGLASCFLIVAFIRYELAFDTHHPEADRTYRLVNEDSIGTMLNRSAITLGRGTAVIPDLIPSVETVTRLHRRSTWLIHEDQMVRSTDFMWADQHAFDIFDFPLVVGDPSTALKEPSSVVITEDLARRLLGDEDPLGKTIEVEGIGDLVITGILAEPRNASHIAYEALASFSTLASLESPWDSNLQGWSYLTLAPGADVAAVEAQLNEHIGDIIPWLNFEKMVRAHHLQAVEDIRLYSADVSGAGRVSDIKRLTLFSIVVVLVLLLACANFANLSTVRSLRRSREVGVRKTVGAGRVQLIFQFLAESVATALLAFLLALGIVAISFRSFAQLLSVDLTAAQVFAPESLSWFVAITLGAGLLAGSYPAVYLSRFQAALIVKGSTPKGRAGSVRNVLVTGQFVISAILIFASTVIVSQLQFLAQRDLGYDSDGIALINTSGLGSSVETLMERVKTIPGVVSVSNASGSPVNGGFVSEGDFDGQKIPVHRILADVHYPEALGLRLVEGRFWDPERSGEGDRAAIVNEAYVRAKGWEDPLTEGTMTTGKNEDGSPQVVPVIGVIEDFNIGSARNEVEPLILDASSQFTFFKRMLIVRMNPASEASVRAGLERAWHEVLPNRPFSMAWLDDRLADLRADDTRMSRMLSAFTLLALLVSNLGMIGLAALAIALRRKEIGVRKVLGASSTDLVSRLSREFMILVVLACALALPVAWVGLERWLQEFAFRIDMGAIHVVIALVLVVVPSLVVVIMQASRSAGQDPVVCLRTE